MHASCQHAVTLLRQGQATPTLGSLGRRIDPATLNHSLIVGC